MKNFIGILIITNLVSTAVFAACSPDINVILDQPGVTQIYRVIDNNSELDDLGLVFCSEIDQSLKPEQNTLNRISSYFQSFVADPEKKVGLEYEKIADIQGFELAKNIYISTNYVSPRTAVAYKSYLENIANNEDGIGRKFYLLASILGLSTIHLGNNEMSIGSFDADWSANSEDNVNELIIAQINRRIERMLGSGDFLAAISIPSRNLSKQFSKRTLVCPYVYTPEVASKKVSDEDLLVVKTFENDIERVIFCSRTEEVLADSLFINLE